MDQEQQASDASPRAKADASEAGTSFTPPAINLPRGGGAIRGMGEKFTANPVTGTGSMSVPLATSPGRSGFGPQLSLSYDSGSGNGPCGFGWSLSLPAITRKTDKGLPQYRDAEESDVFVLSGAEDLVPVLVEAGGQWQRQAIPDRTVGGVEYRIQHYRPRIEGLFARIERWTAQATGEIHWRSISRDNITTLYGKDNNSRIFDPAEITDPAHRELAQPNRIFSWLICESYDDKGNAIVYEYAAENDDRVDRGQANERNRVRTANRYLKRIKYGNRVSRLIQPDLTQASWMFEAVFDYDEGHYEEIGLDPTRPEAEQHRFARASVSVGRPWAGRPDPFSSHRGGFEVRTYRRCRRVLMFHHIPDLPTGEKGYDGLVRCTEFDYDDLDYRQAVAIEDELAHEGSTRFASFIRRITQSGYVRDDTQPVVVRNDVQYATYLKKSLPPLEFEYSKVAIQDQVLELDAASLENLPVGLDGTTYQWVDLDGEGVSGILTEQANAWFYKPNLGDGRFGALQTVAAKPSLADLSSGRQQLLDMAGDGQLDLVALAGATPGFYERTHDEGWEPFRAFRQLPNIPWDEPNLRFVDLDGDGHADVLITEQDVFTWHPSLAEEGFGPARSVRQPLDEERGPRLVLADGTQSIYLADMCGDGLTDLVRIRNGEVCYWPNLGYGRFAAKVTMDNAPRLDNSDQFDQRRVRLADIDGSGTNDIIYLARDGVRLYFNQSGNRWSEARRLVQFPHVDNVSSVMTADLLGNGTACLVWSSPLPTDARRPLRYIELMGGTKPHLLIKSVNNLGAASQVHYAPSTRFYLADKRDGRPWVTRLPFPVHVVDRVVTHDHISGNQFVTRYAYHHGYFDGEEREFRGFGMVEQWDTEEFDALNAGGQAPGVTNVEAPSHVPPVLTKTWFHTGVYLGRGHVSDFFAGLLDANDVGEYYREPGLTDQEAANLGLDDEARRLYDDAQAKDLLLYDTVLPDRLTVEEEREACRALKGSMLRQEVYALDGTDKQNHPYTVTEQNFAIRVLQRRGDNGHAVFLTHARESISYHYERRLVPVFNGQIVDEVTASANPDVKWLPDPRVAHALTLEVDNFGNVLRSASAGYGRRYSDLHLASQPDRDRQTERLITYSENRLTESHEAGTDVIDAADDYRTPLPCESRTYELTGLTLPAGSNRYTFDEVLDAGTTAIALDYENDPTAGLVQKRLIEHVRTYYRRDDLAGPLPLGALQSLALPFENYKLAFTPGLVADVYGGRASDPRIENEGCYVHSEGDANWWIPSGLIFYSPNPADTELDYARQHFFLPHRYRDPFHTNAVSTESFVSYDTYDLLVQETRDTLGNRVTAGERNLDPTQPPVRLREHYRVLQPTLVMDPNRNRSEVAFDALGMVVGTAVMGKPEEVPVPGDRLAATFRTDLTQSEIDQFLANPKGPMAATLLDDATTRVVYDLMAYWREPDPTKKPPAVAATLARETHASEPVPAGGLRIQASLSYSDGFGREIQKKIQAEPEKTNGVVGPPRWVGSGWTIFNNKGNPVRQYEPFFSATHRFEFGVEVGVSPILFYDPVERVVATAHPNHTYEKVVFDPWQQTTYDVNDTATFDPGSDDDVKGFLLNPDGTPRLPTKEYLPTWHKLRTDPLHATEFAALYPDATDRLKEKVAAAKVAAHADTPSTAYVDTLGRPFLTLADNGADPAQPGQHLRFTTRVELDIEGNHRAVRDAIVENGDPEGRIVMRYAYDMLGNRIHQASMEAGERWTLNDVAGNPVRRWDSRGFIRRMAYDELRRLTGLYVTESAAERLAEQTVYGEGQGDAANHRTRVYKVFDGAGVVTSAYDFKGNLSDSRHDLLPDYKLTVNWLLSPTANGGSFTSHTTYDALNRPATAVSPDGTIYRPSFNEANLLDKVDVNLRGAAASTSFVANIDYDAKGQRTLIEYGCGAGPNRRGVTTTYDYDPFTFRLTHLKTTRPAGLNGPASQMFVDLRVVQDLRYTYDPAGNITRIKDGAVKSIFHDNEQVDSVRSYTYDATYRLIQAQGREHIGQTAFDFGPPSGNYREYPFVGNRAHPNDSTALRNFTESYEYDAVGNINTMRHVAKNGNWTRSYDYEADSLTEVGKKSNRLTKTTLGNGVSRVEPYAYDEHGNMRRMRHFADHANPATPNMHWDDEDQLQHVDLAGGGVAYYVYDASGQRMRKVIESQNGKRQKERIYIGGFEVYREYEGNGTTKKLERESLHVMDDTQRIALVEAATIGNGNPVNAPVPLLRYQLGNHLGSAGVELAKDGALISYEECHPNGTTAFQAGRSAAEVSLKRYRYTGKERDEETGFYYHGARYYAPWLGRWIAADPFGTVDGTNLYAYALNSPTVRIDPWGAASIENDFTIEEPDLSKVTELPEGGFDFHGGPGEAPNASGSPPEGEGHTQALAAGAAPGFMSWLGSKGRKLSLVLKGLFAAQGNLDFQDEAKLPPDKTKQEKLIDDVETDGTRKKPNKTSSGSGDGDGGDGPPKKKSKLRERINRDRERLKAKQEARAAKRKLHEARRAAKAKSTAKSTTKGGSKPKTRGVKVKSLLPMIIDLGRSYIRGKNREREQEILGKLTPTKEEIEWTEIGQNWTYMGEDPESGRAIWRYDPGFWERVNIFLDWFWDIEGRIEGQRTPMTL